MDSRFDVRPKDSHSQRVSEDMTVLKHLVDRAMGGCSQCGPARLLWFHRKSLVAWVTAVK